MALQIEKTESSTLKIGCMKKELEIDDFSATCFMISSV